MPHSFATRFTVAAILALSQCLLARADSSFKMVTALSDEQRDTQADSPGPNALNPLATIPGPDIQVAPELSRTKKTIVLIPGHLTKLELDWDIGSVHIGDEKLIEVTPIGGRKVLIKALSTTQNDEEKRNRPPVTRANFYVVSTDNKREDVYEVLINNYSLPGQSHKSSNTVEVHNGTTLADSRNYDCDYTGCKLSGGETPKQ
jgi:hypothetical protein